MNRLNKNYFFDFSLIVFATLPVIISFILDINDYKDGCYWFQRSGSLMVFFAVLLELNALKFNEVKSSSNVFINSKPAPQISELPSFKKTTQKVGLFLAFIGTFIWGYGDIPFRLGLI